MTETIGGVPWRPRCARRNTTRGVAGAAAVAALSLMLNACSSTSSGTGNSNQGASTGGSVACGRMKIGIVGPLTGPSANFGQADENSANLAIDTYNKTHSACKVTLVPFDDKGDASAAPGLATKAVQDSNIVAVLGPEFSGSVASAEPIFDRAGMPTVTSDATALDLSAHNWKVFHRTVGSDGVEGPGEALYTVKQLHLPSVAVINNGEAYGAGIAGAFAKTLPKVGGTVATKATIDAAASNYSSAVLAIKGSKAQAVYCGCLYPEAARLLKQLRQGGVKLKFVSASGSIEPGFLQNAGLDAAEGAVAGEAAVLADRYGPAKQFLAQYVAKYGKNAPQTYAPQGYDAADAILRAIAAGNHSRSSINTHLSKESFDGVSGKVKFAPNGNVIVKTVNMLEVKSGSWQYLTQVDVAQSLAIG